jgi:hypothetical protein
MGAHYTEKCNTQGDYWNKSPQEMGCFRIGPEKYNYNIPEASNLRDACGILGESMQGKSIGCYIYAAN